MSRQLSELRRHPLPLVGVTAFAVLALVLTLTVAGTLSRSHSGDSVRVTAVFRDATGVRAGDEVRVAGVRVGRVTEAHPGTGDRAGRAILTLEVSAEQRLHDDVVASIDYLNLMGQRYVALARPEDPAPDAGRLADGAMIPVGRTSPALDLTALFNAFQPIFDLIEPAEVNRLAGTIVKVLQGQGPTLKHLLSQTARLTNGLVDREAALAEVADNVTRVLETAEEHRGQIRRLLRGLGTLTEGLAGDRDRLGASMDAVARLSRTTADLIDDAGPGVTANVRTGGQFLEYLGNHPRLGVTTDALARQLGTYLHTLSYGSFLNTYVCTLELRFRGAPQKVDLGLSDENSERCR